MGREEDYDKSRRRDRSRSVDINRKRDRRDDSRSRSRDRRDSKKDKEHRRRRDDSRDRGRRDRSVSKERRYGNDHDKDKNENKRTSSLERPKTSDSRVSKVIHEISHTSKEDLAISREAQRLQEEQLLQEEIRKRKERVKAWQEARKQETLKQNSHLESISNLNQNDNNTTDGSYKEAPVWSLEDDNDDEAQVVQSLGDSELIFSKSQSLHSQDDETEENGVFDKTSVKPRFKKIRFSTDPKTTPKSSEEFNVSSKFSIDSIDKSASIVHLSTITVANETNITQSDQVGGADDIDPLEAFMSNLYETGEVETQKELKSISNPISKNGSSSSMSVQSEDDIDEYAFVSGTGKINPFVTNFITMDQLLKSQPDIRPGWESDAEESPRAVHDKGLDFDDEERLEREKKEFLDAIRKSTSQREILLRDEIKNNSNDPKIVEKTKENEIGVIFANEGDIEDEEHMREQKNKKTALEILEESRKGRELKPIDHSSIDYIPIRKNLYIVPRSLAKLSDTEVKISRENLAITVRGVKCPAPVENWEQCGLSDKLLEILKLNNIEAPFAIQKQAIPAIMCGRDIIGVAKTGSGKSLAFILPMIRHIQDQPPLKEGDGPIGLIMAPARELALQIKNEAKKFVKKLGLQVACIYGGAGIAEQIAELKRGAEIVVCTPGRMIELLCMQAGKMISFKRVSMVVMDEADRMFDMGFEPQIKMILQNIRPDRQTVLFSATFPKQIEKVAKSILKYPLEIIVGERSSVNKDITQIVEVHDEDDKYLRLLQLLGVYYEYGSILIFVDKQEKCDSLYAELLKSGYPCVSLHGGKDQVDRDFTIYQFKQGVFKVMIATSVAGRGLDVPEIICVINYSCPNHLEDYVHRVGRTGRAGRKGIAYTFISPKEEQYSTIMMKALQRVGSEIPSELSSMVNSFEEKVARGEAQFVKSDAGFTGTSGYKFDASELNEAQKLKASQVRAYAIENGLVLDEEEEKYLIEQIYDEDVHGNDIKGEDLNPVASNEPSTTSVATTVTSTFPVISPALNSNMTPLERAKALAASLKPGFVGSIAIPSSSSAPLDPAAAIEKARMLARMQVGPSGSGDSTAPSYFFDELEYNDYPEKARKKISIKKNRDEILDRIPGVSIIDRGTYIPPTKKNDSGERKLYLLIEGKDEISVKQVKLELQRLLEEETMRVGTSVTTGRYNVI